MEGKGTRGKGETCEDVAPCYSNIHLGMGSVGPREKNETWQEESSIFALSNLINPPCVGAMRGVEEQLAIWVNFTQLKSI